MASNSTIDSCKLIIMKKTILAVSFNLFTFVFFCSKLKVWIKPVDRSKFMANMMASALGAAITMPICGFLIEKINWQSTFYFTGKTFELLFFIQQIYQIWNYSNDKIVNNMHCNCDCNLINQIVILCVNV